MLIDRAVIFVRSGKGGDGCVSFRREKFVPKGGPDGGNGGRGGHVFLRGDASLTTLLPLTPRPHYRAKSGGHGQGKSKTGADGEDCIVAVPLGTLIYDHETGELLADITREDQMFQAATGGRGGLGNEHFKSATNQAPRDATPGEPWVERTLRLELKLIADVGLVGLPNAGKSTLLRAVSRATPKVADYPFTTLSPHLGIAELNEARRLIVADIPGLIEGAAEGAGLGHDFLRHVERTSLLVHVIDAQPADGSDPAGNYTTIQSELRDYSELLANKPQVIAVNKVDLLPEDERESFARDLIKRLKAPRDVPWIMTSGSTRLGVRELLETCWRELDRDERSGWRDAPSPASAP